VILSGECFKCDPILCLLKRIAISFLFFFFLRNTGEREGGGVC
jgi:hypothetical protein